MATGTIYRNVTISFETSWTDSYLLQYVLITVSIYDYHILGLHIYHMLTAIMYGHYYKTVIHIIIFNYRTAVLVSLLNALTSFMAGFAVFTTLGFMAKQLNTTVPEVSLNVIRCIYI